MANGTNGCLLAMAEIEEYFRMTYDEWFAMLVVFEDRILCNAIFLTKGLFQQLIGQHTEALSLFVTELQGLLPSLLRDLLQSRLEIKFSNIFAH